METSLNKKKELEFTIKFIKELNKCRINPEQYAFKVELHMKYIKTETLSDKRLFYIYDREGFPRQILKFGKEDFKKCIEVLQKMDPVGIINYKKDLLIPIPEDRELWNDQEFLARLVNDKKFEFTNIDDCAFHFDIGVDIPDVSFILQLVDVKKQENFLNKDFKYIGISNMVFEFISCSYFFFSGEYD